jgi:Leucine-rich repeat (LRR) protein
MIIVKKLLFLLVCFTGLIARSYAQEQITFTWTGHSASSFAIRANAGNSYTVVWGDGYTDTYVGTGAALNSCTHAYATPAVYPATVTQNAASGQFIILEIKNMQVQALDVSYAPSLEILRCTNNALTVLDVSSNPVLRNLECDHNYLTALDVSNNVVAMLYCSENDLNSLVLGTSLTRLRCVGNNLTSLNVSANPLLEELLCQDNALTQLTVSTANTLLSTVSCFNNALPLSELYGVSSVIAGQNLGRQELDDETVAKDIEVTITPTLLLNGKSTVFTVLQGGIPASTSDYTLNAAAGKITFHTTGTFQVKMTNEAISSQADSPAEVFVDYDVEETEHVSFTWQGGSGKSFLIQATSGESFTVNWGDGSTNTYVGAGVGNNLTLTHAYANTNPYSVAVTAHGDACSYTYLNVDNREVSAIDVGTAPGLTELHCANNTILSLILSTNTALTELDCSHNLLTTLDVSNNNLLTSLHCSDNRLPALNVTANTLLSTLSCENNALPLAELYALSQAIAVQNNKKLGMQRLDTLTIPQRMETTLTPSITLGGVATAYEVFKGGILAPVTDYTIQYATGKITFHEVGTYTVKKTNAAIVSHTSAPAAVYRTYKVTESQALKFAWTGGTGKSVGVAATAGVTYTVDWGDNSSNTFTGTGNNETLTHTYADANTYTVKIETGAGCSFTSLHLNNRVVHSLDVSAAPGLLDLHFAQNTIATLDVTKNTLLQIVHCNDNLLTALDITQNTALTGLNCANNQLVGLNLSGNPQLTDLNCANDRLQSLSIAANPFLTSLSCGNNAIPLANLYTLSQAIAVQNNKQLGTQQLDTITVPQGANNAVDAVLGGINTLFTVTKQGNPAVAGVDYTTNYGLQTLTFLLPGLYTVKMTNTAIVSATGAPAEVFRTYRVIGTAAISFTWTASGSKSFTIMATYGESFTVNWGDGNTDTYTGTSGNVVPTHTYGGSSLQTVLVSTSSTACFFTKLEVFAKQVSALNVEEAHGLQTLDCSMNFSLQTLNVTNNTDLINLQCLSNGLTALDVSQNTALITLNCSNNNLTNLNLNNNTALRTLQCENNPSLKNLDVTHNLNLQQLYCGQDSLSTLDISHNTQLQTLSCHTNLLTGLNLAANTQLSTLDCKDNRLPALDVTTNTLLHTLSSGNNKIPLANLYTLSQAVTVVAQKELGTQRLDTLVVAQGTANAVDAVLDGKQTSFDINKAGVGTAVPGTDYTVDYALQQLTFLTTGTFTVKMTNDTIKSASSAPAVVYRTYKVSTHDLANSTIAPLPAVTYTGYGITPLPVVTMMGSTLTKDADYTVSYTNNVNVGMATLTITGAGDYYGSNQATFAIVPMVVTVEELSVQTKIYDGSTSAVLLFNILAFKQKLSPADTTVLTITAPTTGTFAQAGLGTDIPVTYTGSVTLGGAKAANYTLIQQTGLKGDIITNNVTAHVDYIANATYDATCNCYVGNCGQTSATVYIQTDSPYAIVTHNGTTGHSFTIDISRPNIWTETYTVSTPDGSITRDYTIALKRWFDVDIAGNTSIVREKWNNTLFVNNNPATNDGYRFVSFEWFRDNQPIGTGQYYSAGDNATDVLDANATYYVAMTTSDGKALRTCPFQPVVSPNPVAPHLSAYPNPVAAGQSATVATDLPLDRLRNATLEIYSMSGRRLSVQRMGDSVSSLAMPSETGIYLIKLKAVDFEKTITIVVK